MSFTDGKPFIVVSKDLTASWGGIPRAQAFRCYLCGYKFKVGDTCRWQFIQGRSNVMVCESCDGPDLIERWIAQCNEFEALKNSRFWWFCKELLWPEEYR